MVGSMWRSAFKKPRSGPKLQYCSRIIVLWQTTLRDGEACTLGQKHLTHCLKRIDTADWLHWVVGCLSLSRSALVTPARLALFSSIGLAVESVYVFADSFTGVFGRVNWSCRSDLSGVTEFSITSFDIAQTRFQLPCERPFNSFLTDGTLQACQCSITICIECAQSNYIL